MSHVEDRVQEMHPVPDGSSPAVVRRPKSGVTTPENICGMGHRMKRKRTHFSFAAQLRR